MKKAYSLIALLLIASPVMALELNADMNKPMVGAYDDMFSEFRPDFRAHAWTAIGTTITVGGVMKAMDVRYTWLIAPTVSAIAISSKEWLKDHRVDRGDIGVNILFSYATGLVMYGVEKITEKYDLPNPFSFEFYGTQGSKP